MRSCAGFDEVGLGPMLGPMVLASCGWSCPQKALPTARQQRPATLSGLVLPQQPDPAGCCLRGVRPFGEALAACGLDGLESKEVYRHRARDFARLELLALALLGRTRWETGAALLHALGVSDSDLFDLPWYQDLLGWPLPLTSQPTLPSLAARLTSAWQERALRVRFQARVVTSAQLNRCYAAGENRARVHAQVMGQLLVGSREACRLLDRWGGRKFYLPYLHPLGKEWRVLGEGAHESSYCCREYCCHFLVKADVCHPEVAAASLLAKYLRELCMTAFNAYWQRAYPGLPWTTGYPVGADSWWAALAQVAPERAHESRPQLWRGRG